MNKFYTGDTFICGANSNNQNVSIIRPTFPEIELIQTSTSEVTPEQITGNTVTVSGLNFNSITCQRIAITPPQSLFFATYHNVIGVSVSSAQVLSNWTAVVTSSDYGPTSSSGSVVIKTAGIYRIYAKAWFQSSSATSRNLLVDFDVTSINYRNSSSSTNQATCEIDFVYKITTTNDYLTLNASSNGAASTITDFVFSIERLF